MNYSGCCKENHAVVGCLKGKTDTGQPVHVRIPSNGETLVGRDPKRCNYVLSHAAISNIHLRIYCIKYQLNEDPPFIYCEDLSRNGTLWNSVAMGKGAVLLSQGDQISVCGIINLIFNQNYETDKEQLDEIQEEERKLFADRYLITNRKLGMGVYGSVYMGINQRTKRQLACKIVNLHAMSTEGHNRDIERNGMDTEMSQKWRNRWAQEVEILESLTHPHIIDIEMVFRSERTVYIFEELVTGGDLFSYAATKGPLKDTEVALIVRQILKGLEYLHSKGIAHRDLKPGNILVTSQRVGSRVLLTDFDSARAVKDIWSKRMRSLTGTSVYVAPEVYLEARKAKGSGYTESIDMHSLGVMTAELLTGVNYWPESDSPDESKAARSCESILRRLRNNEEEWEDVGIRAKDFVKRLIVVDPKKRMTARQALDHHWFTNETHRRSFERLYERAIKNWQPRIRRSNIIEDIILPTPKRDGVISSEELSHSKFPYRVLPGTTRTTYGMLPLSVSKENESPGVLSRLEPITAPTAVMYVPRGGKRLTNGSTPTLHRHKVNDKTTGKFEAGLRVTKQSLQEPKKRFHPTQHEGLQDRHTGPFKRAKNPAIARNEQCLAGFELFLLGDET